MRGKTLLLIGMIMVGAALLLAACQPSTPTLPPPVLNTQQTCPTAAACEPCPTCPEATEVSGEPAEPVIEVPYLEEWQSSAHADATAEAFVHWDEDDPKEVPANCARCHSTPGYHDFLGLDGSAVFVVDAPAPTGTVVTCVACHNQATATLTEVPFPSGVVIDNLKDEGRCMICHQGRASTVQVNEAVDEVGMTEDLDTVSADLSFVNIHYFAAAATLYGGQVHGGYEYEGNAYDFRFQHVEPYDTCIECHNPHTLEVRVAECAVCHDGVASVEDLQAIRMQGSLSDYDGDGDVAEGIASEIQGLQEALYGAIQSYASEVVGTAIVYDVHTHPYWFIDANGNGTGEPEEINGDGRYNAFTSRLLKAAYNYQVSVKDPGAFAHNAKYIIQLLHDSLASLNEGNTAAQVDLTAMVRNDPGHFDGSGEPFRHWDEEGRVPLDCVRCHTDDGLPLFLEEAAHSRDLVTGATISLEPANGLACTTCHVELQDFARYTINEVRVPSGQIITFGEGADANLCLECHQGRESNASVKLAIDRANAESPDTAVEGLSFRNPHYFAAGGTLFGGEAEGAFQYEEKEYVGRFMHVQGFDTCVGCHDPHQLTIKFQACTGCHSGITSVEEIRFGNSVGTDFDGDGDAEEGIALEVETMHEALYAAIQAYASEAGTPVQFNGDRYPYWFPDPNENNTIDEGEERFTSWTPRLLSAAYNYTWVAKDPGSFAHNGMYILQIMYDSIEDLGGDVTGFVRPTSQ